MKKFLHTKVIFVLALTILASFMVPYSYAEVTSKTIDANYRQITLLINDAETNLFDANGSFIEPFIYEGTTYLPLRAVAEALHMEVRWDQDSYSVYLTSGASAAEPAPQKAAPEKTNATKELQVFYHDIAVYVDALQIGLLNANGDRVEPFIYEGTTYLPIRNIAEATNTKVDWDGKTNTIRLTFSDSEPIQTEAPFDVAANSDWSAAQAEAYGYIVDFETYADKNYAYLVNYSGADKDVLVPAKIEGKTTYVEGKNIPKDTEVTFLFAKNESIESVTFEDGVVAETYVNFFRSCTALKYVYNMPHTGTSGANCFLGCPSLLYIDRIPQSIRSFSNFVNGCKLLTSVPLIPSGVTGTPNAFAGCAALEGKIECEAAEITNATDMFKNVVKPVTVITPYPSTTYDTFTAAGFPENVTIEKKQARIGYLPAKIHTVSGTPFTIYNFAVAPGYAENYTIQWTCEIGSATSKGYDLTTKSGTTGEYPITMTISDGDSVLYTAESTVVVETLGNISPNKLLKVMTIGDSYTYNYQVWMNRVTSFSPKISFVGTCASRHEGRAGFSAAKYLEDFTYERVGSTFPNNPFFNPETNRFDWNYYKKNTGLGFNAVQIYLGSSGIAVDPTINANNIKQIVDYIRMDDPEIPIFVAQTQYIQGTNTNRDKSTFNLMVRLDDIFSQYENVYLVPLALTYDRTQNYEPKSKSMPNADGFRQIGETMFSTFMAYLAD